MKHAPLLAARLLFTLVALSGCSVAQRAAQEDPMKCERDPKCEKKRGRTMDCSLQCSDDPACVERCEQFQAPSKLGR
ncbi:MAG TPA: hypothetical protein VM580_10470 [Labilithrix sp.]|jgi:hypothetical protein|nr:hypothetical protein [Labilithrix sp.]